MKKIILLDRDGITNKKNRKAEKPNIKKNIFKQKYINKSNI